MHDAVLASVVERVKDLNGETAAASTRIADRQMLIARPRLAKRVSENAILDRPAPGYLLRWLHLDLHSGCLLLLPASNRAVRLSAPRLADPVYLRLWRAPALFNHQAK
jgi:hypothetical protein